MPKAPKRQYTVLPVAKWDEVIAVYEAGASTLSEIAAEYKVSVGSIMNQAKARNIKRRGTFPTAAAIGKAIAGGAMTIASLASIAPVTGKPTASTHEEKIRSTQDDAYADAVFIQRLIRIAVAALPPPTTPAEAAATMRVADMAATSLDRVNRIRRTVLRLDKDNVDADVFLPELPITVLTEPEVEAMRAQQELEDGLAPGDLEEMLDQRQLAIEAEPEIEIVTEDG